MEPSWSFAAVCWCRWKMLMLQIALSKGEFLSGSGEVEEHALGQSHAVALCSLYFGRLRLSGKVRVNTKCAARECGAPCTT